MKPVALLHRWVFDPSAAGALGNDGVSDDHNRHAGAATEGY